MTAYRTKTYIAADWDGDKDAVDQLYYWNQCRFYILFHFLDAHEKIQARDTSLFCSIKHSLHERLNISKMFVLIVGKHTKYLTKGNCSYCDRYKKSSQNEYCPNYQGINHDSYIEYECRQAIKKGMKILVFYNSTHVNKSLCPEILIDKGLHSPMKKLDVSGNPVWDYQTVKNAFLDA